MQVHSLVRSRVYLAKTQDLIGNVAKFDIPDIEHEYNDVDPLGGIATVQHWAGFAPLKGVINWTSFYPDAAASRYNGMDPEEILFRGDLETIEGGRTIKRDSAELIMQVKFGKAGGGSQEGKKALTGSSDDLIVEKMELLVAKKQLLKVDIWNQIYIVDGKDLLAESRANTGA